MPVACMRPMTRWRSNTRRSEGVSLWVVRSDKIVASDPAESAALFDPAEDKVYRHPTFYDIPDGVENL